MLGESSAASAEQPLHQDVDAWHGPSRVPDRFVWEQLLLANAATSKTQFWS